MQPMAIGGGMSALRACGRSEFDARAQPGPRLPGQCHAQAAECGRFIQAQGRTVLVGHRLDDGQPQAAAVAQRAGRAVKAVQHPFALFGGKQAGFDGTFLGHD